MEKSFKHLFSDTDIFDSLLTPAMSPYKSKAWKNEKRKGTKALRIF